MTVRLKLSFGLLVYAVVALIAPRLVCRWLRDAIRTVEEQTP